MSQQPPPPPYGGPPGQYGGPPGQYGGPPGPYGGPPGPYGGPPGPYGGPPGEPPGGPAGGRSNTWRFWIGVLLAIPAWIVVALVSGGLSQLAYALGGDYGAGSLISAVLGLALFGGFITMVVVERTRWFALGLLAGTAILLILAAGACVVLFAAMVSSYN